MTTNHQNSTRLAAMIETAATHIHAGRLDAAAALYTEALGLAPDDANLHHTLGLVYMELDRSDPALYHIGRSIELNPQNSIAYRSMGDALGANGQFALAISAYEKAWAIDPTNTDALLNLGHAYHEQDMYDDASNTFEKLLRQDPENRRAMNNLARVYQDVGRHSQALALFDRCLAHCPDYADARFNRAVLLLAMGEFETGWSEYECRFERSNADNVYPHCLSTPRWQGEPFKGKRLLVHCEQGMGDVLQFARYLPLVKQRGGTVIVEAHPPLVPLLESMACIDEIVPFDQHRPPGARHHMHIPLLSLPRLFNCLADNIPAAMPYITGGTQDHADWDAIISSQRFNIGLAWASSALNPKRNCPLDRCDAWFRNPALQFVGLQKGPAAGALSKFDSTLSPTQSVGAQLNDFRDTAAVMRRMDLIVSVDTVVAHLAGAMGKPLWVLLPYNADWRWPRHTAINPWYPHARIFRQPAPGDWGSVISEVAAALARLSSAIQTRQ